MRFFLNLYDNGLIRFESQGRFVLTTAKPIFTKLRTCLAIGVLAASLSACGSTKWGFPYRADVQQGNWITTEQVAQLQKGMTHEQVRFILGTPVLQDVFHANRWDYLYFNKPGYGSEQERKFTVWFEGDSVSHWEGDEQPDRQPFQKADTGMTNTSRDSEKAPKSADQTSDSTPSTQPLIQIQPVNPGVNDNSPNRRSSSQPLR